MTPDLPSNSIDTAGGQPTWKRPHILVVDDEAPVCAMIEHYLRRRWYRVTVATTITQAFTLLREFSFDLVILDIVMQDDNGFEVLDAVKLEHPALPVLVLTGLGFNEEILQTAQKKKANGFLSKGLPLGALLIEIRRILKANQR
jgi:DNA-binding NtrC family response regulator